MGAPPQWSHSAAADKGAERFPAVLGEALNVFGLESGASSPGGSWDPPLASFIGISCTIGRRSQCWVAHNRFAIARRSCCDCRRSNDCALGPGGATLSWPRAAWERLRRTILPAALFKQGGRKQGATWR